VSGSISGLSWHLQRLMRVGIYNSLGPEKFLSRAVINKLEI
jgi:hypothetical protein